MSEDVLAATVRLTSAAEALAALAAHTRVETEGLDVGDEIRALLRAIATEITGSAIPDARGAGPAIGMARAFLREAIATIEDPAHQGDWSRPDPVVLQGFGRTSMTIAAVIATAASQMQGLEAALTEPNAAILDVGTGTGWLAIAFARAFPAARVVGIDIFDTALDLAGQNIAAEAMHDRVEVRHLDVTQLDEAATYDLVWLPLPFLPSSIVPAAVERAVRAVRPGGWVVPGTFAGPGERLADLLIELRIRRAGGHPWTSDEIVAMLEGAALQQAHEIARTWPAPVRLWAARRAPT